MTARRRPQPHRFQWPLNPQQLQDIDDTFQILFDELKRVDDEQHDSTFIPLHASRHGSSGDDPVTIAESQVVGLTADLASKVPNTRQVISGAGLTGGGDLSADRTLAVGAGTGITVNADDVALDTASTRNTDHASVTLTAGTGLTGGGDITASRTFNVGAGLNIAVNADDVQVTPQASAASELLGRGSAGGAGTWQEITLGTGLSMSSTTLSNSGVNVAELIISDSQIKSLNTSPLTVISAPGSNKVIVPISFSLMKDSAAGTYSANQSWRIRYNGNTTDLVTAVTVVLTSADIRYQRSVESAAISLTTSTFDARDKSVRIDADADVTGGNAANSAKIAVAYYVLDTP